MLVHYSQKDPDSLRSDLVDPINAGKLACALGLEVYYCTNSDKWFMFSEKGLTGIEEPVSRFELTHTMVSNLAKVFEKDDRASSLVKVAVNVCDLRFLGVISLSQSALPSVGDEIQLEGRLYLCTKRRLYTDEVIRETIDARIWVEEVQP